jgi:chitodextrinase
VRAKNAAGASSYTNIASIVPNNPPVANFTSSCNALTCTFTNTSTDVGGSIASSSWTFGDNSTSTATSPSHTYAAGGTYSVSLTVRDNNSATNYTVRILGSAQDETGATLDGNFNRSRENSPRAVTLAHVHQHEHRRRRQHRPSSS